MDTLREKKYCVGEAARLLGISARCVHTLINSGELRAYRIGTKFVISESGLLDFLITNEYTPLRNPGNAHRRVRVRKRVKPHPEKFVYLKL